MPYGFRDTDSAADNYILPAEALQINGDYIEELFADDLTLGASYETLSVSGRELSAQEATDIEVGVRHGSFLSSRRFKPRELKVKYKLEASSNEHFRKAYNKLNEILNVKDAQLIFADEPDKYFIGTVTEVDEVEPGRNAVFGEFTITCFDPFKYSVQEYEVLPDENGELVVNYDGTMPAYPVLEADFYESSEADNIDGDCGYVAFVNDTGNVLQFGDAEETDLVNEAYWETYTKLVNQTTTETLYTYPVNNATLLNSGFPNLSGWSYGGYKPSGTQQGTVHVGKITTSGTTNVMKPNSYGDAKVGYHGPVVYRVIPNPPLSAVKGATAAQRSANCSFSSTIRLAVSNDSDGKNASGFFCVSLLSSNGTFIAGVKIVKSPGEYTSAVTLMCGGESKALTGISLKYDNIRFGFGKSTGGVITLTKSGGTVSANVGGVTGSVYNAGHANSVPARISYGWGANGNSKGVRYPFITYAGVYSYTFSDPNVKYTVPYQKSTTSTIPVEAQRQLWRQVEQRNTFSSNDILVADCNDATIRMLKSFDERTDNPVLGELKPGLGALGNEWEQFAFHPGINSIGFGYSDWVDDEYAPTPKLRYRKVYI